MNHRFKSSIVRLNRTLWFILGMAWLAGVGAVQGETNVGWHTVVIRAQVPTNVGTVYLTGNRPELGNWQPRTFAMTGTNQERTATLRLPAGTKLEYKFTLSSWDREGLGPSGTILPNHRLTVDKDQDVTVVIADFRKDTADYLDDWKGSGVLGRLEYWKNVPSKFLTPTRHVEIWLPPGYDEQTTNRYDVLYMHDGQNLFDPRIANTGVDWGVDEAVVRGMNAGKLPPLIVVGIWCTDQRLREYSPWHLGTNYARFLIEELMPLVNQKFRTRTGPQHTAVTGSSMGGLISFWLCWQHPEVFGSGGCLSSALMWNERFLSPTGEARPFLEQEIASDAKFPRGARLYFDYGTREGSGAFESLHNKLAAWLETQGWNVGTDFVIRKIEGAEHNEAAWRARLDEPLLFLFGKQAKAP
ncbi:MAG: alpha/beta hydrolase-fold protein [Verrucomicrobiota bacterium]